MDSIEVYVHLVDTTKKQKTYFKKSLVLFGNIQYFFSIFLLLNYLKKYHFSSDQKYKTISLVSNLIFRQYKLELMARFMEIKSLNLKLGVDQKAKELD